MAQEPLIDQRFLEKLERLALRWQKSFAGLVGGHRPSRFAGAGQEFLDHRHFHYGDDLRAVNWRAYLRFEKLFLKMFRVEPRTPVRLLIDTSLSMATGATPKFRYAQRLTAALCYISLVRLDSIFIQPFSDALAEPFRGGGGRHRFAPAVEFLSQLAPAGRTDYFRVARQFINQCSEGGALIIVSDFLDEAGCEKPLQYLADFGHELLLVQLWAEEDREPPWEGELDLVDAETSGRLELSFDAQARARYTAAFDEFSRNLRRLALRNGGRHAGLSTSMSIEEAVFGPLLAAGGVA
jgi:uncharacterized protein (DUF58 family)